MAAVAEASPSKATGLLRVISLGGGVIDNSEAVEVLKKSGATVVYLSVSADTAWQRIAGKGDLQGKSFDDLPPFLKTNNPQETHRSLHNKRVTAYQKFADIAIDAEGKTPEEIAKEILNRVIGF
jgi:shikimate kinase